MTIGCDRIGAIQSITNDQICKSSQKHFNIIRSIKSSMKKSNITWTFRHIKGHQDDFFHYDNLSRDAQLNVCTDNMAKDKLKHMIQSDNWERRRPQHLPMEHIEVYWTNKQLLRIKICSNLQKTLTTHIQTKAIH